MMASRTFGASGGVGNPSSRLLFIFALFSFPPPPPPFAPREKDEGGREERERRAARKEEEEEEAMVGNDGWRNCFWRIGEGGEKKKKRDEWTDVISTALKKKHRQNIICAPIQRKFTN